LNYGGKSVILDSRLGITCDGRYWGRDIVLDTLTTQNSDTSWKPIYGERGTIHDNYNETTFTFRVREGNNRAFQLIVRAYNEGIAFRYSFPESKSNRSYYNRAYVKVEKDNTEFSFPEQTKAWYAQYSQGNYSLLSLNNWPGECQMPLTLELSNNLFVCLMEAEMVDYSSSKLKLQKSKANTLAYSMYGEVDGVAPFYTPWRVIMVAENSGDLLENNDIVLNLNPPCAIEDPSWIKPGKVMREVTLSSDGGMKLVDFAVGHNLQYIHFDAGWYGYEYEMASDATSVTVDPLRNPKGDLDLLSVIQYAKSKGIGVFLYVNQRALGNQLDTLLPLFKLWGVAGIKFGFVHVGSHRWTTWLHDAVKKCAQYELMVDIHDEYRPTGFSRTYPNLMTQEGIKGNEEMPDATHNTILPFTRFIAGAADYTFCYYYREEFGHEKRHIQNTSAHQLALPVVYYSPLQWMYWYDRPSDYKGEPELEFWDAIPTKWDDTKVIQGEIGEYVTIARQSGEDWFIGSITNTESRNLKVPLDFLDQSKKYEARIYSDDPTINTRTKVSIKRIEVNSSDFLNLILDSSGGCAIWIKPI
jgi:alpha-glucosidase